MEGIFRVEVKKIDWKLEERYRRISFDLYRKGARRSVAAWIGLLWYSVVLLMSLGMSEGGESYTLRSFAVETLLIFIWFLAAFRRFRNRVLLRVLYLVSVLRERRKPRDFAGNCIVFGDEGFTASASGNILWKYPAVDKIAESREAVFLYLKEDNGLYFAKSDFTAGNAEAFLPFIAAKTGREVIQVKG